MPIFWGRPSADQARRREGMENLLRSEPHERQNRPEGAQESAQSQERGEDHAQATLVPEGSVGTGRNGEPGRPEGTVANATPERTSVGAMFRGYDPPPVGTSWRNDTTVAANDVPKVQEPRTFKNPHERFCDLEQQCEGLRYDVGRMREELQRVTQFLNQQELDRNPRTRVDAEREWHERQRAAMMAPDYTQSMTASQAERF